MTRFTGLFQRGSSYYLRIVLPVDHPLKVKYRSGRLVEVIGACGYREAVKRGTLRRAQVLTGYKSSEFSESPSTGRPRYLRDVFAIWKHSKARSKDTLDACERALKLYEQHTGNAPLQTLTRSQGEAFKVWLVTLPTTSKTAHDRLMWVNALLGFAQADCRLWERNPWIGLEIPYRTTNKRRPWTDTEIAHLFSTPLHTAYKLPKGKKAGADAAYWIPLIGFYTGARIGELAQLRISDVNGTGDIPTLQITNEGDGQTVKTNAGIRKVPIHSELIRLGFLGYVDDLRRSGHVLLWPLLPTRKGKPGGYFSQWFGDWRRTLGFGVYPDFHCIRHTVRTQLAEAGIHEALIDTLLGHELGGSTGAKVYTHRSAANLRAAIEVIRYPESVLKRLCVARTAINL